MSFTAILFTPLILALIVVVLHIVGLTTPWWFADSYRVNSCSVTNYISFRTSVVSCSNCDDFNCGIWTTKSQQHFSGQWRDNCDASSYPALCTMLPQIFDATFALVIIGLIVSAILLLIFLVLTLVPKFMPGTILKHRIFLTALALIGFLCGLTVVLLISLGIPGAFNKQFDHCSGSGCTFFGETSEVLDVLVWGPATAWIVECVNLLFQFLLLLSCCAFTDSGKGHWFQ